MPTFSEVDDIGATDGDIAVYRNLIREYENPAVILDGNGAPLAHNFHGQMLADLIEGDNLPSLQKLLRRALFARAVTSERILLGDTSKVLLVTVVPFISGAAESQAKPLDPACERILVLARDIGLEQHLRQALIDSRRRYKELIEVSHDFAWEVNQGGVFVFVSQQGALGYPAEALIGEAPEKLFMSSDDSQATAVFYTTRSVDQEEISLRDAQGREASVSVSSVPMYDSDGQWLGARGVCRDVTIDREREMSLKKAFLRAKALSRIVNAIRDEVEPRNMLKVAADTLVRAFGATACQIYRQRHGQAEFHSVTMGKISDSEAIDALVNSFDLKPSEQYVTRNGGRQLIIPTIYRGKLNGALCLERPLESGGWNGEDRLLVADVADQLAVANQQISNHEEILRLSRTDSLTGLLNRRAFFQEEAPRRMLRLARAQQTAALIYVDLDNFKPINDTYGHSLGDRVLLAVRDFLLFHTRPTDAVARLGGDEFTLWLENISAEDAEKSAARLAKAGPSILQSPVLSDRPDLSAVKFSLSLGLAFYDPRFTESIDQLISRADAAMYASKRRAKGSYTIAPPANSPSEQANNDQQGDGRRRVRQ